MQYLIEWMEVKDGIGKNGKPYTMTKMSLMDETGKKFENVSTFDKVSLGDKINGEVVQNGNFLNFKSAQAEIRSNYSTQKKEESITKFQDRKAESISAAQDRTAWMWAKNNATTLISSAIYMEKNLSAEALVDRIEKLANDIYHMNPTEDASSLPF